MSVLAVKPGSSFGNTGLHCLAAFADDGERSPQAAGAPIIHPMKATPSSARQRNSDIDRTGI